MSDTPSASSHSDGALMAAVDLGSNSFHLQLARPSQHEIRLIEHLGEKVQLAAGLDDEHYLSEEAQQRGLDCLKRFAPFLTGLAPEHIRVVGTNALRAAHNRDEFARRAEEILGVPLEIIAGREEARLIYLGAAHTNPASEGPVLIADIGGGSTEFVIGESFEPRLMESLHMGCVSYTERFFPDGEATARRYEEAGLAALGELQNIRKTYQRHGWAKAMGSSGTIKTVANIIGQGQPEIITREGLMKLEKQLLKQKNAQCWVGKGMKPDRARVMPAGLAILSAIFEALKIESMHYSPGALREGLLYEMLGDPSELDVRERTIKALAERYAVDTEQARHVQLAAQQGLDQVKSAWGLEDSSLRRKLEWAAQLHEIGLAVAHTQYHKHGAYLAQYSDLAGFSQVQQQVLSVLIRAHRRKFPVNELSRLPEKQQPSIRALAILLRFAVLLHHSRPETPFLDFHLEVEADRLHIVFPEGWIIDQPLVQADLAQEQYYLKQANIELSWR